MEKLKELEEDILTMMKRANSRTYASLAKQYRETIREIEEIEGINGEDEIEKLLQSRESDGKTGAVRKDRTKV